MTDQPFAPAIDCYAGRQCFVCRAEGHCAHRERDVTIAILGRGPAPPCPVFRYLDRNLEVRIDAAAARPKPIARTSSATARAGRKRRAAS